jgi:hypothetical protein
MLVRTFGDTFPVNKRIPDYFEKIRIQSKPTLVTATSAKLLLFQKFWRSVGRLI